MDSLPNGPYISQRLHLDPASAGLFLDALYCGLAPVGVTPRFVRFGERLWLSAEGLQAEPDTYVLRAVRSVLWFGWRPVRVQVELVKWSSTACEAAIRPLSSAWLIDSGRYARCAASHVEGLVRSLYLVGASGTARTAGHPIAA
jgi:hypothetical protein